MAFSPVFSKK